MRPIQKALLNSLFFGSSKEVRSRCRTLVKQFLKGASWREIMDSQSLMNTQEQSGLLVLHGSSRVIDAYGPQFHCYWLWDQVLEQRYKGEVTPEMEDEVFCSSLQRDWGFLGLIAEKNEPWVWYPEELYSIEEWTAKRYRPLIIAALAHWEILYAEGIRYSRGTDIAYDLWSLTNGLHYVLANMGVPKTSLQNPLPDGRLATILPLGLFIW